MMSHHNQAVSRHRRGAILIAVLVGLGVASALVLTIVKSAALERRLLRQQSHHHQAAWLCAAGLERARQAAKADADYSGETWRVPAAELGKLDDGLVTITAVAGAKGDTVVTVQARFPAGAVHAVQISRSFTLPKRSNETSPKRNRS